MGKSSLKLHTRLVRTFRAQKSASEVLGGPLATPAKPYLEIQGTRTPIISVVLTHL